VSAITIDGRSISFEPGATVMEIALASGIDVPRLCYHPELVPSGGCRLCVVEVEGRPNPIPACGLACSDGMVIQTKTDQLTTMRRDILDLFISEHPLVCSTCDANGACDLQSLAAEFEIAETSFDTEVTRTLLQDDNAFFVRDHQYCILCGKCVRVCSEVVGRNAIDYAGRGFDSHIATPFDGIMVDSSCVFCSSCVQVCPTAALLPKPRMGIARSWQVTPKRSICGYCGVGCSIEYLVDESGIVDARGYAEAPVNGEFLCVKGRSGWDYVSSPDRLDRPLVRRDLAYELGISEEPWEMPETSPLETRKTDYFIPVSWETALDITADRLAKAVAEHGPDSVAGLASARCTNEENYVFQKFMRAGIGTNNVDHCARLCHASTVTGLGTAFGSGAMTNSIGGIRNADCILITGSNTSESHPVISYEVVRAVSAGASCVVIDPRRISMVDHATLWLQPKPGTDIYVFLAMMHVIIREGWADVAFIEGRTEGFEELAAAVEEYTPEVAALGSGVPAELIEQAAGLYALGRRAATLGNGNGSGTSGSRGRSSILYAMGITQRTNGTELVQALADLAMMSGQVGRPSTGVNPLRGQSNVQGACDLGSLPNVLPGYQMVADADKRKSVAEVWGCGPLPDAAGLTIVEMMNAAVAGEVTAMYVMGENPMLSDPNLTHVEQALRSLDFLVCQDIFVSETAQLAHVVLPAASSLEKDGTFTNTERRVQMLYPVVEPPGEALPDWKITQDLARRVDEKLDRGNTGLWASVSTAEIMDEIARSTPSYGGMSHERLAGDGLVWPCPTPDHPGTPVLHTEQFSRGRGKFHAVEARLPAEQPDDEYPLVLSTGRILYHYHTGTMTRRSDGLTWREPRSYAEVNAADADAADIADGRPVIIKSRRGEVRTQARITDRVPPGVVFLAFHWKEAAANLLTQDFALYPHAKIPEFKISAVRIEKPAVKRGSGDA
jgi:formate dehydrogenase alpha subunit